jgi:pyrroline-5-carboxylate reductase
MKVAIIGCGKIGGAIAKRLEKEHELFLFDHHEKKLKGTWTKSAKEAATKGEVVFLCVKPQDLERAAKEIGTALRGKILVSPLAGVDTVRLSNHFPGADIVRIMPNIAIEVGKGAIGVVDASGENTRKAIEKLLAPLGNMWWIPEREMNAFSALAGSGPAFIYLVMEALVDGGVLLGIERGKALEMAHKMVEGAMATLEKSGKSLADLRGDVCSPGGTTIRGVKTLEDEGVRAGVINALIATWERAEEL